LTNPYTPLTSPITNNTSANTNAAINTSNNHSTESIIQSQQNTATNSNNFPNNLTISLTNLQNNKRSFNPYSQQNMLIGEFSEEFIREMKKAREVTDKKYANLPKPNRPCW